MNDFSNIAGTTIDLYSNIGTTAKSLNDDESFTTYSLETILEESDMSFFDEQDGNLELPE